MLYTTFKLLRKYGACHEDYDKFAALKGSDKTYGMDTPIPLDDIVETMGLADGLWALRALTAPIPSWVWLMGAEFAERVLPIFEKQHPNDKRPKAAIQGIRDWVVGKITREELLRFAAAAYDAYANAAYAANANAYAYANANAAANNANAAYAAAYAAYAANAAAYDANAAYDTYAYANAAYDAERKWQTDRFLELLRVA